MSNTKQNSQSDILIFYLTANDRFFYFDKFIEEIFKCKNINKLHLLIVNSTNNMTYYTNLLINKQLSFECVEVKCPKSNYLPKVRFAIDYAIKNNYKYIFKCDNDMIIPAYTIDYITENISQLDNNYLTLSPTVSTGMPTVEYFINEVFTKEECKLIRSEFSKCMFNNQPGIFDYRFLNNLQSKEWDYTNFFKIINGMNTWYKGVHPIRYGFGNDLLNQLLIKYKHKIFENKICNINADNSHYIANMCFFINTNNYNNLINVENLTVNGCDDVQLFRYSQKYNIKHGIVSNGFAIHVAYGWRWDLNDTKQYPDYVNINCPTKSLLDYETLFFNELYNN